MEKILQESLTQIFIALLGLASAYAIFLISKAKAKLADATEKNIRDEAQRKLIKDAFDRISLLAEHVVAQTQQVSVDALKQAIADGKVDKAELLALGKQATDTVYGQLNENSKVLLETELSDVKSYIESVVEAQVLKLKNNINQ